MSVFSEIFKGGTEGVLKGAGTFAKDIRAAITGKDPLTAEQRTQIELKCMALEEAALNADVAVIEGQTEINKADAASGSNFRGGWRPAIGWICAMSLLYEFIVRPLVPWIVDTCGYTVTIMPSIDMNQLMGLLLGMLGLGGMRTFERIKGVIPQGR